MGLLIRIQRRRKQPGLTDAIALRKRRKAFGVPFENGEVLLYALAGLGRERCTYWRRRSTRRFRLRAQVLANGVEFFEDCHRCDL